MRVLLNCFGFFKPATIITERELFSECQIALFIADMCHLNHQIRYKKIRLQISFSKSDLYPISNIFYYIVKHCLNLHILIIFHAIIFASKIHYNSLLYNEAYLPFFSISCSCLPSSIIIPS